MKKDNICLHEDLNLQQSCLPFSLKIDEEETRPFSRQGDSAPAEAHGDT